MKTDPAHRILIFGMEFPPSATGSAAYAARLAGGLSSRGVEVRVLAAETADGGGAAFDSSQNFEVVRLPYVGSVARRYLLARRSLRRMLAEYEPDLLWATNGMACRVAGLLPIPGRTALISSVRGSDILRRLPGKGLWRRLESIPQRRCYRNSMAIGAASEYLKSVAVGKGIDPDAIFVSPSAVDLDQLASMAAGDPERSYPFLDGKTVLLTVARLVAQKRVDLALGAFARIAEEFPGACLAIAGDGPERQSIQRDVSARGLASRVHLLGSLEPMSPALLHLYRRADLFLMLGVCEGMPNVFMEAGACRLPSVGADSGGTPEIVRHGETGLLAAADDERDAARQLRVLLQDANLRETLGDRAYREVADRFSLERLSRRSFEVVDQVLKRRALERGLSTG